MVNRFESSSPATPRPVAGRVGWGGGGVGVGGFGLVNEYLRVLYIHCTHDLSPHWLRAYS